MADLPPDALVAGSMMPILPLVLRLLSYFSGCRFCTCRLSFRPLLETLDLIDPKELLTVMDKREGLCTVPDLLFDYEKDELPRELENLKPEEFLEEPDKPNLVFLPKKDLARICEMLSPKEFLALSQTCRFLHWRMMKFCHCSVENLEVYIRPEGRRSNGNVIHHVYPKMDANLHRKQLLFHNVHLYHVPTDLKIYLDLIVLMLGGRKNIKRLEITYVEPEMEPPACLSNGGQSLLSLCSFLRVMAPSYLHMEVYDLNKPEKRYNTCTNEVRTLPHLTEGSCAREKEVIVRSPRGIYLCVQPVIIDKLLKLFLGSERCGIQENTCCFPVEHYQEVESCVKKHCTEASERMEVRMKSKKKEDDSETFVFTFPGERYQLIRVFGHCVYLLTSRMPFEEGDY